MLLHISPYFINNVCDTIHNVEMQGRMVLVCRSVHSQQFKKNSVFSTQWMHLFSSLFIFSASFQLLILQQHMLLNAPCCFFLMIRTYWGGTMSQAADSTGGTSGWRSGPEPLSQNSWGQTHCLSGGYRALCSSWLLLGLVLRSVVLESWLHCSQSHLSPFSMLKHLFPCFLPPVEQHGFLYTKLLMPRVVPGLVLNRENLNWLIDLLIFSIAAFKRKCRLVLSMFC